MAGIGIVGVGFMGMKRTRIPFFAPPTPQAQFNQQLTISTISFFALINHYPRKE